MDILIIGGTKFLGRHIAEAALGRGHRLTLFHRGQTNRNLFPNAEHVFGDRLEGFDTLAEVSFDAVIDTCGYFKRALKISTDAFRCRAQTYLFISTISVYKNPAGGPDENAELCNIENEDLEEITGDSYGPLKAVCERVVRESFGDRAIIVRPGLIVGPDDPTGRFTYWPVRFHRGGEVLAPDRKDQPVQIIDVRDLADFCLGLIESKAAGVFNATGPEPPFSLENVLERIRKEVNPEASIRWTPVGILQENEVQPWSDLPFVLPYDGSQDGMLQAKVGTAIAAGLRFRSLESTARDTMAWFLTEDREHSTGIKPEREQEILSIEEVSLGPSDWH